MLICVPVSFFAPALARIIRRREQKGLSLYHRCLCVLLAYMMLLSPVGLESIANASSQYSQISTADWASYTTIEYGYDDNGSCITKTTKNSSNTTVESVQYAYNLQNKLDTVTTDPISGNTVSVVEYTYNDEGIRVKAVSYDMPRGGGTHTNVITKTFLIDPQNHTGYAQILEESDGTTRTTYTIGDDVITQCSGTTPKHLIYDGHGSTRQLTDNTGALVTDQVFNYDGYGVMVGYTGTPQTNLLYTGEYFDADLQQYNLRARYYNPLNGQFNQMDPYAGNMQDPQSLHKYLYCHANPVNAMDPLGLFSIPEINISMAINTAMRAWTGYSVFSTAKKAYQEGIGALTFFDWLFLGLDVLHVTSAVSWLSMTSIWKKQAALFHGLGEQLVKTVGRARGSIAGQLGTQMHEALKSSWLGRSVSFLQRQLANYEVEIFIEQAIGTGVGSRPDITILLNKFKLGIAFDLKAVPKGIFYSGVLPSYKWLYEQSNLRKQREGTIGIINARGYAYLYFYIPYPSFVL